VLASLLITTSRCCFDVLSDRVRTWRRALLVSRGDVSEVHGNSSLSPESLLRRCIIYIPQHTTAATQAHAPTVMSGTTYTSDTLPVPEMLSPSPSRPDVGEGLGGLVARGIEFGVTISDGVWVGNGTFAGLVVEVRSGGVVGVSVANRVGIIVGAGRGAIVSAGKRARLGVRVGVGVGDGVGAVVSTGVGACVGIGIGASVCAGVGTSVGDGAGSGVGDGTTTHTKLSIKR